VIRVVLTAAVVVATQATALAMTHSVGDGGIQTAIDAANPGDVIKVPGGVWKEHLRITKSITIEGDNATVDGEGKGKVITISAPNVRIQGLIVRGSGSELTGEPDSCIWVEKGAERTQIVDNELRDCGFGIWIHTARGVVIEKNKVYGRSHQRVTDRGNGIHLFDATDLTVRENFVTGARDGIYVSATENSVISYNVLTDQRYGIHYMFSYDNTLQGNRANNNLGGLALMQSRNLKVIENITTDNEKLGILFRDAQYCAIEDNVIERNGQGLFFFSSTENSIRRNRVAGNDIGVKIWAGSLRNAISENSFIANRQQIFYVGATDLILGTETAGNFWSDYVGWDQNGDGSGDRPHRLDSFTSTLVYRYPAATLLLHSPGVEFLTHMQEKMPLLQVPTVVDVSPKMRPHLL
jgi:nitrous oxidase accessory protein